MIDDWPVCLLLFLLWGRCNDVNLLVYIIASAPQQTYERAFSTQCCNRPPNKLQALLVLDRVGLFPAGTFSRFEDKLRDSIRFCEHGDMAGRKSNSPGMHVEGFRFLKLR